MTHKNNFMRAVLQGSTALSALAVVGGGMVASAVVATPAFAQDYTNVTATGRVVDQTGTPIPGATVTVTSNSQGFTRTTTTDGNGVYRVPALPQGTYTFTISAPGQQTFTDPAVPLLQSSAGNEFVLGGTSTVTTAEGDTITVVGRRVQISDFDRTTTGAVISIGELAERVPVARDLTSVILLAPGTSQGDTAFGNLAAISGSSVSENAFFLNGLNITEFREGLGAVNVPFEFYNTIEVKNGGIPAEFGRFTGGFINAITKSGGNEFHGGVLFNYIPDDLYEDAPDTLIDYNQDDYTETKQVSFNLSGPIIKDRLFFFAFYRAQDAQSGDTQITVSPSTVVDGVAVAPYSTGLRRIEDRTRSPFYGIKLDALVADGHRLEGTYFNSTQTTYRDAFGLNDCNGGSYDSRDDDDICLDDFQTTTRFRLGGENYVGRYTGQFTDWLTLSAAYGKNENLEISGSTNDAYPFIGDTSGFFSPALSGNALNVINDNTDTRKFYRGDVDLFFSAFGQHHVKAGYDKEELKTNATTRYTGGVAWVYTTSGAGGDVYVPEPNTLYVTGRTFINGGTFTSENEAFYIQDAWSLFDNRLTLNLGVRNDRFSNDNVAGETYFDSGDNWAPRLAFSADPFGDGRTKLYGSFGRYYLPVVANTNIRLAGAELDYTRYFRVAGVNPDNTPILGAPILGFADAAACPDTGVANCDIISDGEATPTESTVAKNLSAQSVDEYVLGVERNIGSRIRVGLYGQYRTLNESLEDVAIDAAVLDYCDAQGIAGCDALFTGFHQYVLVNPGSDARITLSETLPGDPEGTLRTVDFTAEQLGYPEARRTYKAITATFDREFDGIWSLAGSYTWSKSKGNIEGGIRSDNGQTDSGLTTAFDQPGLTDGAYGYLPGDNRHKFKLYGSYAPFEWLTLGANFSAQSPRRFGCIGRVPRVRDQFAGAYGAAGFYCNTDAAGNVITDPTFPVQNPFEGETTLKITPRGSQLKSDWQTVTNVSAAMKLLTNEAFDATFRVDVFNLFNEDAVTDLRELGTLSNGTPRGDYGSPLSYQQPRYFRFQLGFDF